MQSHAYTVHASVVCNIIPSINLVQGNACQSVMLSHH